MKVWIAYILSFYILFSATVPCTFFDNCEEENNIALVQETEEGTCKDCSPFSVCTAAAAVTLPSIDIDLTVLVIAQDIVYGTFYADAASSFHSRLFQPPRYA